MTIPTLYLLAQEYRAAAETLADLDLPAEAVADTLEGMAGDLEQKAVNVVMLARSMEAMSTQIKEAERAMKARREALDRRAASLTAYALGAMRHAGISKISSSPLFVISVRATPAAVEIQDADLIPAEFMRTPEPPPPALDKVAIRDALKAGRDVPGCRMVAGVRLHVG